MVLSWLIRGENYSFGDLVMMKQKSIFAFASKVTETLGYAEVARLVEHDLAPRGHGYDLGKDR